MRSYHGEAVKQADIALGKGPQRNKPKKEKPQSKKRRRKTRTAYGSYSSEESDAASPSQSSPGESPKLTKKQRRVAYAKEDNTVESRLQTLEAQVQKLQNVATPKKREPEPLPSHHDDESGDSDDGEGMDVPKFLQKEKLILTQEPEFEERGSVYHVDSDSWRKLRGPNGEPLQEGWIEVKSFALMRGWGSLEFPKDQILLNPNKAGKVLFLCVRYLFRVCCFATRSIVHSVMSIVHSVMSIVLLVMSIVLSVMSIVNSVMPSCILKCPSSF